MTRVRSLEGREAGFVARIVQFLLKLNVGKHINPVKVQAHSTRTMLGEPRTHDRGFTLDGGARNVRLQRGLGVVLLALLLIGVARAPSSAAEWKAAAYASIVIIAYNGILHSFWGDELFLYASHWLIPLVVLIGGWLQLSRRAAALTLASFAALTLAVAALNAQTLAQMFALLRLQAASQ
jgi:hypothetical protein